MAVYAKRALLSVIGIIVGAVLLLTTYWTVQRNEVVRAAQSGLNAELYTNVHIKEVKLDDVGTLSKWFILPFRKHNWFVVYQVPKQGNATSMGIVAQNERGQWAYEPTPPIGMIPNH